MKVGSALIEKIDSYKTDGLDREYPLDFEKIHMASSGTLGRILALKRGVEPEMAIISCILHDYGRIVTGYQKDHARNAYEPVKEFLKELGEFSKEEIEIVATAAKNHSSKDVVGTPIEEIVKDADVFDCWQYDVPMTRPEQKVRLERVLKELV
nr:HD domain-containing protein [Alkalibacter mobilis]